MWGSQPGPASPCPTLAKLHIPGGLDQLSPRTFLVLCLSSLSRYCASSQLSPPLKSGALLLGSKTACIHSCLHPDSLGDGCSVILEKIIHISRF